MKRTRDHHKNVAHRVDAGWRLSHPLTRRELSAFKATRLEIDFLAVWAFDAKTAQAVC